MRLPRMTTRRWMVVVLVVGLTSGAVVVGIRLKRRQSELLAGAEFHAELESLCRLQEANARAFFEEQTVFISELEKEPRGGFFGESLLKKAKALEAEMRKTSANLPQQIAYHAELTHKYRHAARYPWLSVEPDPPEPRR